MKKFNGDNYGIVVDNSINLEVREEKNVNTVIQKEKTTIGDIFKEKLIELLVELVISGGAAVVYNKISIGSIEIQEPILELFIKLITGILSVVGIIAIVVFIVNLIKLSRLSKKGNFVEFMPITEGVSLVIESFRDSNDTYQECDRTAGKCYKNLKGKIYEIKGMKCPICETEPIGNMHLMYSKNKAEYYWSCSENRKHMVEFDYKKKF